MSTKQQYFLLFIALALGLLVRIPGIFWGSNFPTGWKIHHIDEWTHYVAAEAMIDPSSQARWYHPYPKGMAAHSAVPWIAFRALNGDLLSDPPSIVEIVVPGRVITVLYGTASILVLFLIARYLLPDPRIAVLSAFLLALGGLHVTQSHFFLADVPALFWMLLGIYLLLREFGVDDRTKSYYLLWAAFCFGIAFGIKLTVVVLPSLFITAIMFRPRLMRTIQSGVFFLAGFVLVNFLSYTPVDFLKEITGGVNDPYIYNRFMGLLLYLIELPSLVSFPILIAAIGGGILLAISYSKGRSRSVNTPVVICVYLPMIIYLFLVIFNIDHFPRHLLPFLPWIYLLAAIGFIRLFDWLKPRKLLSVGMLILLFIYLGLFVYDGERVFLDEPRNEAARWLMQNVVVGEPVYWRTPDRFELYPYVHFPEQGRPSTLVIPMDDANHYLSGMNFRDSYPSDYRNIFDSESQVRIMGLQDVFRGNSEYQESIRFKEGYFMPDYLLVDELLGNRSRNYVSEIVIFQKERESQ